MIINTMQAKNILKFKSGAPIVRLIREGKLTDLGKTREGKKKHYYQFDAGEVRELAKQLNGRFSTRVSNRAIEQVIMPSQVTASIPSMLNSRLKQIEDKLDLLIKIWS